MPDPIDRLAELFEKATPGEWIARPMEMTGASYKIEAAGAAPFTELVHVLHGGGHRKATANEIATYIAAAHNLMPRILDVLRAGRDVAHKLSDLQVGDKLYSRDVEVLNEFASALDALQEGGE